MTQLKSSPVTSLDKDNSLLLFSMGPVQSFISSAVSLKDLWSGSFILSWLTLRAIEFVVAKHNVNSLITPSINQFPVFTNDTPKDQKLSPCFPNRFLARIPSEGAREFALGLEAEVKNSWKEVCDSVKNHILKSIKSEILDPLKIWDKQCESLFEIHTVVMPFNSGSTKLKESEQNKAVDKWQADFDCISGIMQAKRAIRHIPTYSLIGDRFPMKCSLMGTYEQMGPVSLSESRSFWETAPEKFPNRGARIRKRERFCAISLVKRYAWPAFFKEKLGIKNVDDLRYSDLATIAAKKWLNSDEPKFDLYSNKINGQWLHQDTENNDDVCPKEIADLIKSKIKKEGLPPTYYAILMVDGDKMGELLRKNKETLGNVSAALSEFSQIKARQIVEDPDICGELIYSGGDDVLALLPTSTAIECAEKLNQEYSKIMIAHNVLGATLSAGLVIVHYKEDLRYSLSLARDAEKNAKSAGRDCMYLGVCKGSGGLEGAIVPWNYVPVIKDMVDGFVGGASNGWAYQLRQESEIIQTIDRDKSDHEVCCLEIARVFNRTEKRTKELLAKTDNQNAGLQIACTFKNNIKTGYADLVEKRYPKYFSSYQDWITLMLTTSFLARGRDR